VVGPGSAGGPPTGREQHGAAGSVEAILALVRRRGGRLTAARRALVDALAAVDGHVTAEELVDRVRETDPSAHLSTIYRNLEELEALGVVSHSHLGHGAATYQLVSNSHAHFRCTTCGTTLDAADELFDDVASRVRAAIGFEIEPSHFVVEGQCRECRAAPG
jgi:Fur family ferric uptake transcriptional regulator